MQGAVSIYDVARKAGVSHTAVAHVLNPRSGNVRVSVSKADRIRQIADELGYVPHLAARSLSLGKTHTIVLITIAALRFPHVHELIEKIQAELRRHRYHLSLELALEPGEFADAFRSIGPGRCDGVIALNLDNSTEPALAAIRQRGIAAVAIDPRLNNGFDTVDYDRRYAVRVGMKHLLGRGHSRVAFLVYWEEKMQLQLRPEPEWISGIGQDGVRPTLLMRGYYDALREAGFDVDEALIIPWSVEWEAAKLWDRIRSMDPQPTAVFCYNERWAASLVQAVCLAGGRVPDDLAVITLGNSWLGGLAAVPLTAIDLNDKEIARVAVDRLMKQIQNPQEPTEQILIKPFLVERQSANKTADNSH